MKEGRQNKLSKNSKDRKIGRQNKRQKKTKKNRFEEKGMKKGS